MLKTVVLKDKNSTKLVLGLIKKAGKLNSGVDIVCDSVRHGKTNYVILSKEASENTQKKIKNCCEYYDATLVNIDLSKEELGESIGKNETSCVCINDKNFIKLLENKF